MARSVTLVASDAGGVGKTWAALMFAIGAGPELVAGFDGVPGGPPSKLVRLLADRPHVFDVPSLPAIQGVLPSEDALLEPCRSLFDRVIGDGRGSGASLTDTGSGTVVGLAQWARSGCRDLVADLGIELTTVVVTTATATSLAEAQSALASLAGPGGFPAGPSVLVCNAMVADFDDAEGQDWTWLLDEIRAGRSLRIDMPRCIGGMLPMIESGRLSVEVALGASPSTIARRVGWSDARGLWAARCFAAFVSSVLRSLEAAQLLIAVLRYYGRAALLDGLWVEHADRAEVELFAKIGGVVDGRPGVTIEDAMAPPTGPDVALSRDAFPELLAKVVLEIRAFTARGVMTEMHKVRRGVETHRAHQARQRGLRGGQFEPRLGVYRRDAVLFCVRAGLPVDGHQVAGLSHVYDAHDRGWAG